MSDRQRELMGLEYALMCAQRDARPVEKDKRNEYGRYDYASAEGMILAARDVLGRHGLAIMLRSWELDASSPPNVRTHWVLMHEGGQSIELKGETPAIEAKQRPLDKAVTTALTYAQSYMLRGLLNLPRVEKGSEVDERDDSHHVPEAGHRQRRESDDERAERRENEANRTKRYKALKAKFGSLGAEYMEKTGTPKEAMRDAVCEITGWDFYPERPSEKKLNEAIHSLTIALKEIDNGQATD